MEAELARAFQEEVRCPICLDTLMVPVTVQCGHTFCRPCLRLAWEDATTPARCPACREPSQRGEPRSNVVLGSVVSLVRKASLRGFLSSREHRCGTHGEPKQMFCEEDESPLCGLCSQVPEHRAHRHQPVERAAAHRREAILQLMETLWERKEETQRKVEEQREIMSRWGWFLHLHRTMTKAFYATPGHPGLREGDRRFAQELLLDLGRRTSAQLQTTEGHLLEEQGHLRSVYQELMRAYQKPDVELLQDFRDGLELGECALLFQPQTLEPMLGPPRIRGLVESLSPYRVEVSFGPWTPSPPLLAASREEEAGHQVALGAQVFSAGRHYWELSPDDSSSWAVGVCGNPTGFPPRASNHDLFVLFWVEGSHPAGLFTTSPLRHHYLERPLGRVGVFLDLDHGTATFLNVARKCLLWRYPTGSIHFPVRPFLSRGAPLA